MDVQGEKLQRATLLGIEMVNSCKVLARKPLPGKDWDMGGDSRPAVSPNQTHGETVKELKEEGAGSGAESLCRMWSAGVEPLRMCHLSTLPPPLPPLPSLHPHSFSCPSFLPPSLSNHSFWLVSPSLTLSSMSFSLSHSLYFLCLLSPFFSFCGSCPSPTLSASSAGYMSLSPCF